MTPPPETTHRQATRLPGDTLRRLYRGMVWVRMVEERIAELYPQQEMRCPVHLSIGQEAVAAGVAVALPECGRAAFSSHRSHGHYLAMGGSLRRMMAELYGKATGNTAGKGGSMHLTDYTAGFWAATPIVGSTIPIAVGFAFGRMQRKIRGVTVAFLGEGATEEGAFYEAVNFAVLKRLPVLFVCENNLYSVYSPLSVRQPQGRRIWEMVGAMGLPSFHADGNDAVAVYSLAKSCHDRALAGEGPMFMEFDTYRWREHCGPGYDNDIGYRTPEEYESWRKRCPIERMERDLLRDGVMTRGDFAAVADEFRSAIDDAVKFAKESPFPDQSQAYERVYADVEELNAAKVNRFESVPTMEHAPTSGGAPGSDSGGGDTSGGGGASGGGRQKKLHEAIREATDQCLTVEPDSYLIGLGVPDPKGIFGTTAGLLTKHGPERVLDMPCAENGMTGVIIGSALAGTRPIMTHQRVDFALLSVEQLVNQAAKWHYMFGGLMCIPLVVRMIIGRGWGQGPQHSQSLQAMFAHIPGLKVVMPATPHDAKGLLVASVEDPNPVIFLEYRWLHGLSGPVPESIYRVPLGKARRVREGRDVTIVASSYMTIEAIHAVKRLADEGVDAELIDLRTILPLDREAILDSVSKTGRLVVADTGATSFGVSAEIVSLVTESAFDKLKAAPRRVALPDVPVPTSPALTKGFYPRAVDIANAALSTLGRPPTTGPTARPDDASAHHDVPDPHFTGPF